LSGSNRRRPAAAACLPPPGRNRSTGRGLYKSAGLPGIIARIRPHPDEPKIGKPLNQIQKNQKTSAGKSPEEHTPLMKQYMCA